VPRGLPRLKKIDLSPEEEEVIERLSRSLVGRLLRGPISKVMARAEAEISFEGRRDPEASCGLERHGGRAESSRPRTDHQICKDGKLYSKREFDIGSNEISTTLHDPAQRRIGVG
jgi:hypothetical protein